MSDAIAKTPSPPYYAVIFSNTLSDNTEGYEQVAERMVELASEYPGFLGIESVRETLGVTVSYWRDLESIRAWKANMEHRQAQRRGREQWYSSFKVRIAKVERDYAL